MVLTMINHAGAEYSEKKMTFSQYHRETIKYASVVYNLVVKNMRLGFIEIREFTGKRLG